MERDKKKKTKTFLFWYRCLSCFGSNQQQISIESRFLRADIQTDLRPFWEEKMGLIRTTSKGKQGKRQIKCGWLVGEPLQESQLCDLLLFSTLVPLLHAERTKSISQLALKVYLQYTFLSDIKHKLYFTKHKRHYKKSLLFSFHFNSV